MNGSLLIFEADSIDQVHTFLAGDPYKGVDLFANVEVRPWLWALGKPE
jgi:uncharacterized protein YciI